MRRDQIAFRNPGTPAEQLIIDVNVAVVTVFYTDEDRQLLELFEKHQVFHESGKILPRGYNGIAETMKQGERPHATARRCLVEELKFSNRWHYALPTAMKIEHRDPVPSEKWPGLLAAYHRHVFECVIEKVLYNPSGYIEHCINRDIIFEWKPWTAGS